jgi:enoyl-CoA hydratase
MSEPVLRVETQRGVATVALNRPNALNALSRELRAEIARAFRRLAADGETRVIILTGSGRAFCAGLDLKEISGEVEASGDGFADREMLTSIADFEGPIIGAINGFAITGGFELALACDLLIASSDARFADTHARVGIMPGWGLSQKLSRLIGIHRAKELSFTGNYLSAEQAEAWGLVNRVVAPDELLACCRSLAEDMLSCVPDVLRGYKQVIDSGFAGGLSEGLEMESRISREHAKSVTPEQLSERRKGVQARGRSQEDA